MSRPAVRLPLALALALVAAASAADQDYVSRMEAEHAGDSPVASPAAAAPPAGEVEGGAVVYATLDGREVQGYLASPAGQEEAAAGLLLIHEWWGLNDNIRAMAERFAGEGYVALAVDLYEGEAAGDREGASRLARAASEREERLVENLRQAAAFLGERGVTRLGVVGWCFGGGWSLRTALALPGAIAATVVYYGRVPGDAEALRALRSPVLGHFGSEDGGIPPAAAHAFQAALAEVGVEHAIHVYEGADHAFANPSGTRYQEAAATEAWDRTLDFFGRHLR